MRRNYNRRRRYDNRRPRRDRRERRPQHNIKSSRAANVTVYPRKDESPERLIKRFIKKVKKEGIMETVRDRKYYKKPSEVRREKAIKRQRQLDKLKAAAKAKESTTYRKKRKK